jgi:hypothetical protein
LVLEVLEVLQAEIMEVREVIQFLVRPHLLVVAVAEKTTRMV